MNFIKRLFNKEEKKEKTKTLAKEVYCILEEFNKKYNREVCRIKASKGKTALFESKFGGIPYCPIDGELPSKEGRTMKLLAQINFSEVPPMKDFPSEGILQFFISPDDLYGMDLDAPTVQEGFRVIYHAEIDRRIVETDVLSKVQGVYEEELMPLEGEYGLSFTKENEGISGSDYRFDALFTKFFNQRNPDHRIKSFFDLDEEVAEVAYNSIAGDGHKIGGYPLFTQTDSREYEEELQKFDVLLLQIDSDFTTDSGNDIMWGDAGVGNFFISQEDLKRLKFDQILYNWDCG